MYMCVLLAQVPKRGRIHREIRQLSLEIIQQTRHCPRLRQMADQSGFSHWRVCALLDGQGLCKCWRVLTLCPRVPAGKATLSLVLKNKLPSVRRDLAAAVREMASRWASYSVGVRDRALFLVGWAGTFCSSGYPLCMSEGLQMGDYKKMIGFKCQGSRRTELAEGRGCLRWSESNISALLCLT